MTEELKEDRNNRKNIPKKDPVTKEQFTENVKNQIVEQTMEHAKTIPSLSINEEQLEVFAKKIANSILKVFEETPETPKIPEIPKIPETPQVIEAPKPETLVKKEKRLLGFRWEKT